MKTGIKDYIIFILILLLFQSCSFPDTKYTHATEDPYYDPYDYYDDSEYVDDYYEDTDDNFEIIKTDNSSCFSAIAYDHDEGDLYVMFREEQDRMYLYEGVELEVWEEFRDSSSLGSYYNTYIKGQYDCYRFDLDDN